MVAAAKLTATNVFATIESMSTTITSHTMATNATWPFVTIPNFVARGSQLLELSGSFWLALSPLVTLDQRVEWEQYSVAHQGWLSENLDGSQGAPVGPPIMPFIWRGDMGEPPVREDDEVAQPYFGPFWQVAPPVPFVVNQNIFAVDDFQQVYDSMLRVDGTVLAFASNLAKPVGNNTMEWPFSYISSPVRRTLEQGSDAVAIFSAVLPWHSYFYSAVPDGTGGMYVVVKNSCQQAFTYLVYDSGPVYIGPEDKHDTRYSHLEIRLDFDILDGYDEIDSCRYTLHAYPSHEFHETFMTFEPIQYTLFVVAVFLVTSLTFIIYDCFVRRKDIKVMSSAENTNAIVSSLFPAQVRERLLEDAEKRMQNHQALGKGNLTDLLEGEKAKLLASKPIADLFPNVTVMFADIAGFTAWSSVREPQQVFVLLEQIYGSFDVIAKRRGVFKVETIGDCYVAASGMPHARADHAVIMAKFAQDCLNDMQQTVIELEVLLGPDTAELAMRVGLHSGPVTAGVLRGQKSRFQLFGDTVNTAGRMESTGTRNRIHISQDTADCLIKQGKGHWMRPREDSVAVKGKGDMQTYWIDMSRAGSVMSRQTDNKLSKGPRLPPRKSKTTKKDRLVEWNVETLKRLLKNIIATRDAQKTQRRLSHSKKLKVCRKKDTTVLDEVQEIICLPGNAVEYKQDPDSVEVSPEVVSQLRDFVTAIAEMYQDNPFHNFDHASHVAQSVTKLLARVVTPDSIDYNDLAYVKKGTEKLHEYTHGVASDPWTQFACAFSALIHDVDHTGVPNAVLIKENASIAKQYRNKSVAEQNSVDLAWNLLEELRFKELRNSIYSTGEELQRFRQLVVNSVMATDIADKELGAARKKRWAKAFNADPISACTESPQDGVNRKATIVIEHIIQASDVSHTMQHWHVYLKWNERLFREMYKAYKEGRMENDPSEGWYKGELGFFDFYLIPLGKKLKECQVFGVASDEYLNYAVANRREWELKGKDVLAGYLARLEDVGGQ